ncbi:MAG: 3,4-dihydroxy-2-butanone-4-phosphate synthase, partial [Bacteroidales bacterium]|nr:3,4-dihydroxy-2-butanone-4-phosphate synthase [Bacteroidales bacterium]
MKNFKLNTIEEAIGDIREGKLLIVVDDEDRENEGDFICAAELITPEIVNFMAKHGRGLICVALPEERCEELELNLMVGNNTSLHETQFTVTVDLLSSETTTGVSAKDRALTIKALVDPLTKASDLGRPGHIFPLKAKAKGVLRRAGHTEAVVDLTRFAGLRPGGALVEIMNDDGSMARLSDLIEISRKFNIKVITIRDLIRYTLERDSIIERGEKVNLPTESGNFEFIPFRQTSNGLEHAALVKGTWTKDEPVLVRVHSS